jgi:hypothetical protein
MILIISSSDITGYSQLTIIAYCISSTLANSQILYLNMIKYTKY